MVHMALRSNPTTFISYTQMARQTLRKHTNSAKRPSTHRHSNRSIHTKSNSFQSGQTSAATHNRGVGGDKSLRAHERCRKSLLWSGISGTRPVSDGRKGSESVGLSKPSRKDLKDDPALYVAWVPASFAVAVALDIWLPQ